MRPAASRRVAACLVRTTSPQEKSGYSSTTRQSTKTRPRSVSRPTRQVWSQGAPRRRARSSPSQVRREMRAVEEISSLIGPPSVSAARCRRPGREPSRGPAGVQGRRSRARSGGRPARRAGEPSAGAGRAGAPERPLTPNGEGTSVRTADGDVPPRRGPPFDDGSGGSAHDRRDGIGSTRSATDVSIGIERDRGLNGRSNGRRGRNARWDAGRGIGRSGDRP